MNTELKIRIEALAFLGQYLSELETSTLNELYDLCYAENKWFTKANIIEALQGIRNEYLNGEKLNQWVSSYQINENKPIKKVGLILAGNIPAVGFNDILCVFLSGNISLIKYSEKDKRIIPHLLAVMINQYPQFQSYFIEIEMLKDFDAVIATGSDNSSRYFNTYFGKYPHIIRKNRNSVAVLNGTETTEDIQNLGNDIFSYFGLGCRNVSKLFFPIGYNKEYLLEQLHQFNHLVLHDKYKNNFDYNIALFLLNRVSFQNNGCIIIFENPAYASRIASLHYEYYDNLPDLENKILKDEEKIQCVVSKLNFEKIKTFAFGTAQCPALSDYADGVDTMNFLSNL